MLKIYGRKAEMFRLLPYLAEFKVKVISTDKIKGFTRKVRGGGHKVVQYPIS